MKFNQLLVKLSLSFLYSFFIVSSNSFLVLAISCKDYSVTKPSTEDEYCTEKETLVRTIPVTREDSHNFVRRGTKVHKWTKLPDDFSGWFFTVEPNPTLTIVFCTEFGVWKLVRALRSLEFPLKNFYLPNALSLSSYSSVFFFIQILTIIFFFLFTQRTFFLFTSVL